MSSSVALSGFMQTNRVASVSGDVSHHKREDGRTTAPEQTRGEQRRGVANSINDLSRVYDIKENEIIFGTLGILPTKSSAQNIRKQ